MNSELSTIGLQDLPYTMLKNCPQLCCLGLPYGFCTDLLPSLAPKDKLLHVHLQLKMGIEDKLAEFLKSNQQITQLSLLGPNEITKELENKFFAQREILGNAFKTLGNLESLHLRFDPLEPCSFLDNYISVIFSDITAYKHLKHIYIIINARERESFIHEGLFESLFKALLGSKSIEKLSIFSQNDYKLKDTTINIIRKFLEETISLKEFRLYCTEWKIKTAELGKLFTLSKSVTKLGLRPYKISSEGIFGLMEGLKKNSILRNIDLEGGGDNGILEAFYSLLINQNSKLQKIALFTYLSDINVLSSIFKELEDPNNLIHKNPHLLNMDIYIDSDLNLHREDPDFDLDLHKEIRYKKKCYTYRVGDIN